MGKEKIDLSFEMFGVRFKNPIIGASGTVGYGTELSEFSDLGDFGAVITKGISKRPRVGNPPPRLLETPSGLLNSIGLENIGAERFIDEVLPKLKREDTRIIVNVFGETVEGYREVSEIFSGVEGVDALEINLSCPNIKEGGIAFGRDPEIAAWIVKEVKGASNKPVIAKLTPNVTDIVPIAKAVEDEGADAISLINTLLGMAVNTENQRPYFKNVTAGLSGPAIRPVALRFVWEAKNAVKIPIIGIGGIVSAEDALEFIMAGAEAVEIGTANFINPKTASEISGGIRKYMNENKITNLDDIRGII